MLALRHWLFSQAHYGKARSARSRVTSDHVITDKVLGFNLGSVHHAFMHELMIVICKHVPVCLQACGTSTYVCMLVCSFAYCMQFSYHVPVHVYVRLHAVIVYQYV